MPTRAAQAARTDVLSQCSRGGLLAIGYTRLFARIAVDRSRRRSASELCPLCEIPREYFTVCRFRFGRSAHVRLCLRVPSAGCTPARSCNPRCERFRLPFPLDARTAL